MVGTIDFSIRGLHHAVRVHRHGGAAWIDWMCEEIAHHIIVEPLPDDVLAAGNHDGVGTAAVVFHVAVGDETARVAIGRFGIVHVHHGAVVVQFEQLPGTAVVIAHPAAIEDVREAKEAIRRRGGGLALPGLRVVARAGEHHDAVHLLMHGETSRRGAAVRDAAQDDLLPSQSGAVLVLLLGDACEPSVRVMRLDAVVAIAGHSLE